MSNTPNVPEERNSNPNSQQFTAKITNRRFTFVVCCATHIATEWNGMINVPSWVQGAVYQYYDVGQGSTWCKWPSPSRGEENRWSDTPKESSCCLLSPFLQPMMFQSIFPVDTINLWRLMIVRVFRNKLPSPFTPLLRLHHHHVHEVLVLLAFLCILLLLSFYCPLRFIYFILLDQTMARRILRWQQSRFSSCATFAKGLKQDSMKIVSNQLIWQWFWNLFKFLTSSKFFEVRKQLRCKKGCNTSGWAGMVSSCRREKIKSTV